MAYAISRATAPVPEAGTGDAGPLSLEDTTRTEWDILMTRNDRWVTCRSGITDPAELHQELTWFQMGNPSGSVTYRVLERTLALRERLLDAPPGQRPVLGALATQKASAGAQTLGAEMGTETTAAPAAPTARHGSPGTTPTPTPPAAPPAGPPPAGRARPPRASSPPSPTAPAGTPPPSSTSTTSPWLASAASPWSSCTSSGRHCAPPHADR